MEKEESIIPKCIVGGAALAAIFGGIALVNRVVNYESIKNSDISFESRGIGLWGHTEYMRHANGMQDVKKYHPLGLKLTEHLFYQDVDGDDKVDVIRANGGETMFNKLSEILTRNQDYNAHRKEFDNADSLLRDLKNNSR